MSIIAFLIISVRTSGDWFSYHCRMLSLTRLNRVIALKSFKWEATRERYFPNIGCGSARAIYAVACSILLEPHVIIIITTLIRPTAAEKNVPAPWQKCTNGFDTGGNLQKWDPLPIGWFLLAHPPYIFDHTFCSQDWRHT